MREGFCIIGCDTNTSAINVVLNIINEAVSNSVGKCVQGGGNNISINADKCNIVLKDTTIYVNQTLNLQCMVQNINDILNDQKVLTNIKNSLTDTKSLLGGSSNFDNTSISQTLKNIVKQNTTSEGLQNIANNFNIKCSNLANLKITGSSIDIAQYAAVTSIISASDLSKVIQRSDTSATNTITVLSILGIIAIIIGLIIALVLGGGVIEGIRN